MNPPEVQAVAKALDFDRVFASPSLNGAVPRGVKLSPDGRWLTVLRGRTGKRARIAERRDVRPGDEG